MRAVLRRALAGRSKQEINKILTLAAFRLVDNPDLTPEEALHNCSRNGHLMVTDWDRDIDWNQHYILLPEKCKVCGVKFYGVMEIQPQNEIRKRFPNALSAVPESSSNSN